MRCPVCGDEGNRVVDTRLARDGQEIRRRRECEECGKRFTTRERLETTLPRIIKRDERRENYDRDKLRLGIDAACVKRPVSAEAVETLIDRVEQSIQAGGEKEVSSQTLGREVLRGLTELDHLAAVRFASVFEDFQHIEQYSEFFSALETSEKQDS